MLLRPGCLYGVYFEVYREKDEKRERVAHNCNGLLFLIFYIDEIQISLNILNVEEVVTYPLYGVTYCNE